MTPARALAIAAASSIAITLALAAPVLRDRSTALFGFELVGRHHDPFTMMALYDAGHLPRPYLQPATDLPGIALTRLAGALSAYNALVLMTFPLAALAAFAHARHVIGSPAGALVAALLFMMAPFHLAQAAYHVHIAQVQWLPLFFLALWRLIERPGVARALALAAALLVTGASSFYFGFIAAVIALPAALAYAWLTRPTATGTSRLALAWVAGTLAVTGAATFLVIWIAFPDIVHNWRVFAFPQEALDQHSARWWSYLLPPAGHPWLGGMSTAIWQTGGIDVGLLEQQVSLGVAVLALACIPLVAALPGAGVRTPAARALAATAIVAALCSLPPTISIGTLRVPMPSSLLYDIGPMFRAYARFGVIVSLMITTLAGAGFAILLVRRSRGATVLAYSLLALAAIEYWPPSPLSRDVLPTSAHRWLAHRPGARLFDCVTPSPGATAGVSSLMGVEVAFPTGPLSDCADPELAAKLAAYGYTHVLVRRDSQTGTWIAGGGVIADTRPLRIERDATIYEVAAARPLLFTQEVTGLYPREYRDGHSWRWMGQSATMAIINVAPHDVASWLELELEPFAVRRSLQISVDQQPVATIAVKPERASYRIGPFTLTPGLHTVAYEPDGTSVPASRDRASDDARALSVRIYRWRWHASPITPAAP